MKKPNFLVKAVIIVLLGIIFLLGVCQCSAQQFYVGPKVAFGPVYMINKKTQEYGLSTSRNTIASFGGTFKYYPDKNTYYSNSIEALYVEASYDIQNIDYRYYGLDVNRKINSITVPVLLNSRNQDWGLYGEIGLAYTYILKSTIDNYLPIKFNKNNLNAIMGFGFDNKLSRSLVLTTGLRGTYNLLDATSNVNNIEHYRQYHNIQAQFVLGLSFYYHAYHDNH